MDERGVRIRRSVARPDQMGVNMGIRIGGSGYVALVGCGLLAVGLVLILQERDRAHALQPLWSAPAAATTATATATQPSAAFADQPQVMEVDPRAQRAVVAWAGRGPELTQPGQGSPDGQFRVIQITQEAVEFERRWPVRGRLLVSRSDLAQPARWISTDIPAETVERLVLMPLAATTTSDSGVAAMTAEADPAPCQPEDCP